MTSMRSIPFANSLAGATAIFAIVLFGSRYVAPRFFAFVFNSQFFGADVASLLPPDMKVSSIIAAFAVVVITAWIFGFIWAVLYNRWSNSRS